MEFGLSEDQILLRDSVQQFLAKEIPLEEVRRFSTKSARGDTWERLADHGIAGMLLPENCGGTGLTIFDAAIVSELLGYNVTPNSFIGSAVLLPHLIPKVDSSLAQTIGIELASGTATVGIALGETIGARADGGIIGDGMKLNGKALYVHDFGSTHYLVADSERRLYLTDSEAAGIEKNELSTIDKTRLSGSLTFNQTPAKCLTNNPKIIEEIIDIGRIMLAADTLGAAQNMLDQAVQYAKVRKQFNRQIGSFQAVKHMCAEMAAALEPCRAMLWYAAYAAESLPDELHLVACHTKSHISEIAKFVAKTATEVHGGMGFTDLLGLHYWFKRIGYNRQLLGSPDIVRQEAAKLL